MSDRSRGAEPSSVYRLDIPDEINVLEVYDMASPPKGEPVEGEELGGIEELGEGLDDVAKGDKAAACCHRPITNQCVLASLQQLEFLDLKINGWSGLVLNSTESLFATLK